MKAKFKLGIITMVLVISCISGIVWSGIHYTKVNAEETKNKNTIQVTGQGKIKVKPDTANITLGVKTQNKLAKVAQQENAKKMDAVIKAIKKAGISEKDIKTSNYSIYPRYKYIEKEGKSIINSYEVNNQINVTIKDLNKVGNIIDISVEEGVNVSNRINFYVSNQKEYYQEALKQAVLNAKGKADAIASVIDIKLGKPSSIIEQSYGGATIRNSVYANDIKAKFTEAIATPIQPSEVEISASVNTTYEY